MDGHDENRLRRQEQQLEASDERLKAAVQFTVGKICEEHVDAGQMTFSREFIAQLGQLTFDFVSDTWAKDLELFARHAKRTSVNADDVKLLVRNNPSLLAMLTEQADAIMAAATVQREQSAKRKQIKKDEGEERRSPDAGLQQAQPPTVASTDSNDDSLDGIDWDAFDQPISTNPSTSRPQVTRDSPSTKAGNEEDDVIDMFNNDSDVDDDFQRPSTSRPAHLDSTRLPAANSSVLKTSLLRSTSPVANEAVVSPEHSTERNFSPVKRVAIKDTAAKSSTAESAPKRRSEDKGKNISGTAAKKAKRAADKSNRSTVGNLTMINSFDDDDDFV